MGLNMKRHMRQNVTIDLTKEEIAYYMEYFRHIDVENKGFMTLNDIRRYLQVKKKCLFRLVMFEKRIVHFRYWRKKSAKKNFEF